MAVNLPEVWLVCVSNNPRMYREFFTQNPFYREGFHFVNYDNRAENLSIPLRYNHFMDTALPPDGWVAFCHQDFKFEEDVRPVFANLSRDCIYGAVGTRTRFSRGLTVKMRGLQVLKTAFGRDPYTEYVGRIKWLRADGNIRELHRPVTAPETVDTVDPCCLFVHTDLIRKHNLRFDPFFDFHLYTEEFSVGARLRFGVETKVAPVKALHYSKGGKNDNFYDKLVALIRKYPDAYFSGLTAGIEDLLVMRKALGMENPKDVRNMLLAP